MPRYPIGFDLTDIVGKRFGGWTVLAHVSGVIYVCRCHCGAERSKARRALLRKPSASCGCVRDSAFIAQGTKHGMARSREYATWNGMIQRCTNPMSKDFSRYGKRGITVCERWRESFDAFFTDMGPKPAGMSIDRIDGTRGYEPGNCRWATRSEQQRNLRSNRLVTHDGQTRCLSEWAALAGLRHDTLSRRLKLGWPFAKAIAQPLRGAA